MARNPRALATALLAGATGLSAPGCGPGAGAPQWVDARAAVVRCAVAGPDRVQPILGDLPTPTPPTGLYARALDPMALDALGYAREQVACATLLPTVGDPASARRSLTALLDLQDEIARDVARGADGVCACDVARTMGADLLLPGCERTPVRPACTPTEDDRERLRAALAPLREATTASTIPLVHWRVSGPTDRPGWFARRVGQLLAQHPGPSDPHLRGEALPDRTELALARALLDAPDVTAVVVQDTGQALLVVREVDDVLVLDHLSYPPLAPSRRGLVRYWESLHAQDVLARLAAPQRPATLRFDPRRGTVVEMHLPALAGVDAGIEAASILSPHPHPPGPHGEPIPAPVVEHAAVQAPFGTRGTELVARFELSEAGREWAQAIPNQVLSPTLDELGTPLLVPFAPPEGLTPLPFVLRGTWIERVWAYGPRLVPPSLAAVEMANPGAISGKVEDFSIDLRSPPADIFPEDDALDRLRARLAERPHVLRGGFDAERTEIRVHLAPD